MALSLASAALAFQAPAAMPSRSVARPAASAVTMAYSWSQPGEGAIFDPIGLLNKGDKFERLRYVEVKHGRIAMLAVLGHVTVASGFRFPGELAGHVQMSAVEGSGFKALSQLGVGDLATIFLTIGFLEIRVMKEVVKGEFPGDLRNGMFKEGWDNLSDMDKKRKINIELNNGRAAMMGIFGLMVHEMIDGKPVRKRACLPYNCRRLPRSPFALAHRHA